MSSTITKNVQQVVQNGIDLLHHSGFHQLRDVTVGQDLLSDTVIVRPLHVGSMLVSYLIGEREMGQDATQTARNELVARLQDGFSAEELANLCFALTIPYEDLGANTHSGRVRSLVEYGQRRSRLADIIAYGRRERPHLSWPHFPVVTTHNIKTKPELAVVVCINQQALEHAASALTDLQIDCNFVLLTTVADYNKTQWLSNNKDWQPAVQDFYQTMQHSSLKIPRLRRHFFFATPLPYAFAIGCAWGLVHQGDDLYHWGGTGYIRVLTSNRDWKTA